MDQRSSPSHQSIIQAYLQLPHQTLPAITNINDKLAVAMNKLDSESPQDMTK